MASFVLVHGAYAPAVAAGEEIVLAGHSYGGMLVTAASNRRPGLVSRLVYLDAFLPGDGQSQWDLMAPAARTAFTRRAQEFGDGWRVPPPTDLASLGVTSPIDQSWVGERLTAHPLRTFLEPLALSSFSGQPPVRRYIACQREVSPFSAQEDALRADPNWEYHEIVAGHDAMITHPEEIADLFSRSS